MQKWLQIIRVLTVLIHIVYFTSDSLHALPYHFPGSVPAAKPLTKTKSVRCFEERIKKEDDRNFDIETRRQDEDVKETLERSRRNPNCDVKTTVVDDDKYKGDDKNHGPTEYQPPITTSFKPPIIVDLPTSPPVDINYNNNDFINIQNFNYDYNDTYRHDFPIQNSTPVDDTFVSDVDSFGPIEEQGYEHEKRHGSSSDSSHHQTYSHREYSEEKTRRFPGSGKTTHWKKTGEYKPAKNGPGMNYGYETSANDLDYDWHANRATNLNADRSVFIVLLLEITLIHLIA